MSQWLLPGPSPSLEDPRKEALLTYISTYRPWLTHNTPPWVRGSRIAWRIFSLLLLPRRSRKTGILFLFDSFLSPFLDHILRNATSWLSVSRRWERRGRVSPKPSWWVAKEEKTDHGPRNERVFSDLREVVRLLAAHPRSRRMIASSLSRFAFVLGIPYSPE